jgi:hypothetical protein
LHASVRPYHFQKKIKSLVGHDPVCEDSQVGERGHIVEAIGENISEPWMQSRFATHEINQGDILDSWQKIFFEKLIIHGFTGSIDMFIHVLVCKAVIAL